MKKNIGKLQYILFALTLILPMGAQAANFTIVPSVASVKAGETITSSIYVNPKAGETITAVKVSLSFPADIVDATTYTPVSGGSILAHIGTNIDHTNGTISDNVAFNPGITKKTKIATVVFKSKKDGSAKVTFANSSKILDSANANTNTGSVGATFDVVTPPPVVVPTVTPPPVVQTPPKPVVPVQVKPTPTPDTQALAQSSTTQAIATSTATSTETLNATTTATSTSVTNEDTNQQLAAVTAAGDEVPTGSKTNVWYYLLALIVILGAGGYMYSKKKK